MNLIAFSGGLPGKNGTRHTFSSLRWNALSRKGAKTKLCHLYDPDFTGCTSWFACKRAGKPRDNPAACR
jgi:multimeric flavodoxin WrbA